MIKTIGLLVLLCATSSAFAICSINLRVVDYPPQYILEKDGTWSGLAVEAAELLLGRAGCEVKYLPAPWKRTLMLTRDGIVDMMPYISMNAERGEYMHFIGPLREETMSLVVLEDTNYRIDSLDDFKKLSMPIGAINGGFYGEIFKSKYETDGEFVKTIKFFAEIKKNVLRLKLNRLSGFILDQDDLKYSLKTDNDYEGLKLHSFTVHKNEVYFGFSKKTVSNELLSKLETAFTEIQKEGGFEEIINSYY